MSSTACRGPCGARTRVQVAPPSMLRSTPPVGPQPARATAPLGEAITSPFGTFTAPDAGGGSVATGDGIVDGLGADEAGAAGGGPVRGGGAPRGERPRGAAPHPKGRGGAPRGAAARAPPPGAEGGAPA